jgi:hypothetical protein
MPRGEKTPAETVAKFRAEYLRLGNASEAGRIVGLPVSTSADLAREANEDEAFVEARRSMYANALDEAGALMLDGIRIASRRVNEEPLTPKQHAELMEEHSLKSLSIPDPRPQYLAQIVAAHKAIVAQSKLVEDSEPLTKVQVEIVPYKPPAEPEEADKPEPENGSEA